MTDINATKLSQFKLIEGTDAIRAEVASVAKAGKKLDDRIQVLGLSVMHHIEAHGDVTVAGQLINEVFGALSKGHRKLAFVEWMLAYGKVAVNMDPKTKGTMPLLFAKTKTTNLEGAATKQWFDFKPEPAVDQAFDFARLLGALIGKAEKAAATGKEVIGADLLAAVRQVNIASAAVPAAEAAPVSVEDALAAL